MIRSIRDTIEAGRAHVDCMDTNHVVNKRGILSYRGNTEEALKCAFEANVATFKQLKALALKVEKLSLENQELRNHINQGGLG